MKKIILFLSLLFAFTYSCFAQDIVQVAHNFGSFPGFNSDVRCLAVQSDGKIILGGTFTSYLGGNQNRLIRLNPDGSKDTSFNIGSGFNNTVFDIKVQPDGKILVGGFFSSYKGVSQNRLIRLNSDGTKDSSFNIGTGFNSSVWNIELQSDGKILLGGFFTSYNGVTENKLIRLNSNGTKDNSFILDSGFSGWGKAMKVQSDGKILIGGATLFNNGLHITGIFRLNIDGSIDTSFSTNTGSGFDYGCNEIKVQNDGKIIAVGGFTVYNGTTENRIIRLNEDGTKDTSFVTGTGFNFEVFSIDVNADGKILVGGNYDLYNGVAVKNIVRLNTDGTVDASFNSGLGFSSAVVSIKIQSDGKILAAGSFMSYNGITENRIIRLHEDGTKDTSFNTGSGFGGSNNDGTTTTSIRKIEQLSDGKILVGGDYTIYNRKTENRIISFNSDFTINTSFNTGSGFYNTVNNPTNNHGIINTIKEQPDGKILLGGWFGNYNGIYGSGISNLIRLNTDGTRDTTFNLNGTGFNTTIRNIDLQPDGKILVGGYFYTYNGIIQNGFIRLNSDGSKDVSFNIGTSFNINSVSTVVLQPDGKILVGGEFTSFNGNTENRIIRLNSDGSKDLSFNTGTGFNNDVYTIKLLPNDKILIGGRFTTYNEVPENRLIRLNPDGTKDNSFDLEMGFNNDVYAIELLTDNKILVGGRFSTFNGTTENRLIRLNHDGSRDSSFYIGTGFNNTIRDIKLLTNGTVLVGGEFTTYNGSNASGLLIALNPQENLDVNYFTNDNILVIYPNPVADILHIQSSHFTKINTVKIIDLQGKLILEDTTESINVSSLSKGLYIVKVVTEDGEFSKKFIKK